MFKLTNEMMKRGPMEILVILTCFNRKDKTEKCIITLSKMNPDCEFTFVVVDDNSTDGTREMIYNLKKKFRIFYLKGDGCLFYSGGMRKGMDFALIHLKQKYEYMFMCNDDVEFYDACIEKMAKQSEAQNNAIIVGAVQNPSGEQSYGAVKYIKGTKYRWIQINEWNIDADTFNANAVLIPYDIFKKVGAIDAYYVHSLGDFDYGFCLKKAGYHIYSSKEYVGLCQRNSLCGGWNDIALSRCERIRKKESIKGLPTRQWFHFLKKNFGLITALKGCITPYIRIIIGK